ncbi:translation initiation factor eIF4e [Punctularia strigosozonata HHB-11173 SS5]|uniref:translation initiation factor eIF4e n=1 Tax=Punctularia strigosozonata (strain HHB-11173) TaxID=741275 RepID=UPI0004416D52|nr:translation initiation factor eIF4e [Punctularia strigosozonata HHB-11173 SS5]EIN09650.1 translation initiation factor eIF4e [Punctularia strigosozonata HHB-11173 SS5]
MAGYFSNHSQSQSRFPSANATNAPSSTTTAVAAPGKPTRIPSSGRFSTSVSSSGDDKTLTRDKSRSGNGTPTGVHPLKNTWVFWFRQQRAPGNKTLNYEEGIKKVAAFSSVESFWSLWTHVNPPSALQPTTDYLLFHSGVRRPVWEDPVNISGGKWILRLKKGVADRIWEDLVLAIIGDQFADADSLDKDGPEICGCTISVRQSEDVVQLWNRQEKPEVKEKIRETMRRVLNLPASTIIEYKSNNG